MSTATREATITDHEAEQVERAHVSGRTPVAFVSRFQPAGAS
jgi:hypothetical protein